jgi:DNA-binding NarL/FixJ family response regulator
MGATRTLKVMLVEDHAAFREALAIMLSSEPDIEVIAQAGSLAGARETLEGGLEKSLDVAVGSTLVCPTETGAFLSASCVRAIPASRWWY